MVPERAFDASDRERASEVSDVVRDSYMRYAVYTIGHRALPRVEDGMKPVQRRLVLAAHKRLGLLRGTKTVKSAKVLGETMGTYHPHGDAYGALTNLTQVGTTNVPVFEGQGNWGDTDDPPAASRYTECKLAPVAELLLDDLDFVAKGRNYDDSEDEEVVLAAAVPWLWVNGTRGIAVGMGTALLPHNLGEVIDATLHLVAHPDASPEDLCRHVLGPDFPTGGYVCHSPRRADEPKWHPYATGNGRFRVRVRIDKERDGDRGEPKIVIRNVVHESNRETLIDEITKLCENGKLSDVKNVIDASDAEGVKIIVEPKPGANIDVIVSNLYKHTSCERSVSMHCMALSETNTPEIFSLKRSLAVWLDFRRSVVTKRHEHEASVLRARLHVVEGIEKIVRDLKRAIKIVTESQDPDGELAEAFGLTPVQAKAVFDLTVRRLTRVSREELADERRTKAARLLEVERVLGDTRELDAVVCAELREAKKKHAKPRQTQVLDSFVELTTEDLIVDEPIVVLLDADGYIRRVQVEEYRQQRRKGKGISSAHSSPIVRAVSASAHDDVLIVTSSGRCYYLPAYSIPEASRSGRGCLVKNLRGIELTDEDRVASILTCDSLGDGVDVFVALARGSVVRCEASQFRKSRKSGLPLVSLRPGDSVVSAVTVSASDDGGRDFVLFTRNGMAVRSSISSVRTMGRGVGGVRGIGLVGDDVVVAAAIVPAPEARSSQSCEVVVVTSMGLAKRFSLSQIPQKGRGGRGVQVATSTGSVLSAMVSELGASNATLFAVTDRGKAIRVSVDELKKMKSRGGRGTSFVDLADDSRVVAAALIPDDNDR